MQMNINPVVWWSAPSPHSKRAPGSNPSWFSPCMRGFSPASSHRNTCMSGQLVTLGVSVSVHGCVALCFCY